MQKSELQNVQHVQNVQNVCILHDIHLLEFPIPPPPPLHNFFKKTSKIDSFLFLAISRKRKGLREIRWWQNNRIFGAVSEEKCTINAKMQKTSYVT